MSTSSPQPYGLLFTLDGYGAPYLRCADSNLIHTILCELPPLIGMRPIGEPQSIAIDEPGIQGISGFTFIMESHISIHTYSERGFVTVDIYSCKSFDTTLAENYLRASFGLQHVETTTLLRGINFHTPLPALTLRSVSD
jgi:S-adenosylmethionine decarboxylase